MSLAKAIKEAMDATAKRLRAKLREATNSGITLASIARRMNRPPRAFQIHLSMWRFHKRNFGPEILDELDETLTQMMAEKEGEKP